MRARQEHLKQELLDAFTLRQTGRQRAIRPLSANKESRNQDGHRLHDAPKVTKVTVATAATAITTFTKSPRIRVGQQQLASRPHAWL